MSYAFTQPLGLTQLSFVTAGQEKGLQLICGVSALIVPRFVGADRLEGCRSTAGDGFPFFKVSRIRGSNPESTDGW